MGTSPRRIPSTSPWMSKEGNMLEKPTNLNFMEHDVIKSQPMLELDRDPYLGVERIPKEGTHIVSSENCTMTGPKLVSTLRVMNAS
jgi:hypothetical protein